MNSKASTFPQSRVAYRLWRAEKARDWDDRKKLLTVLLPMGLFSQFCLVELVFLQALTKWIETGQSGHWIVSLMLTLIAFPVAWLLGLEGIRFATGFLPRSLEIDDQGLILRDTRPRRVRWERLRSVLVESVNGQTGLKKVTFVFHPGANALSWIPHWKIGLDQGPLLDQLLDTLTNQHGRHPHFTVRQLDEPPGNVGANLCQSSAHWNWIGVLSLWLMLHGLVVTLEVWDPSGNSSNVQSAVHSPNTPPAFERFVAQHFQSRQQMRNVLLGAGVGTTMLGTVLFVVVQFANHSSLRKAQDASEKFWSARISAPGRTLLAAAN